MQRHIISFHTALGNACPRSSAGTYYNVRTTYAPSQCRLLCVVLSTWTISHILHLYPCHTTQYCILLTTPSTEFLSHHSALYSSHTTQYCILLTPLSTVFLLHRSVLYSCHTAQYCILVTPYATQLCVPFSSPLQCIAPITYRGPHTYYTDHTTHDTYYYTTLVYCIILELT